jgi:hypothetical protein
MCNYKKSTKLGLAQRINQLEDIVENYYNAIFDAKESIGEPMGIHTCGLSMRGNEERFIHKISIKQLKDIIRSLPMDDGGVI